MLGTEHVLTPIEKRKLQQTSLQAYLSNKDVKLTNKERVYREICRGGEKGRDDREIGLNLQLPINVVTGRRNELVKDKKVVDSGKRNVHVHGKSKVQAIVWVATKYTGEI